MTDIEKLRMENNQLQEELHRERLTVVELKRKIDDLEGQIRQNEKETSFLQECNKMFSIEADKLHEDNKVLQDELQRYRQIRIPRTMINNQPNKRLKSKEKSPDDDNVEAARVRIVLQVSYQSNLC